VLYVQFVLVEFSLQAHRHSWRLYCLDNTMFVMFILSLTKFLITQRMGTSGKLCARYGQRKRQDFMKFNKA
jgi:hypothetical protein